MEEEEDLEQFYFEKEQEDQVRDEFFAVEEAQNAVNNLSNPPPKAKTYTQARIDSFFKKS